MDPLTLRAIVQGTFLVLHVIMDDKRAQGLDPRLDAAELDALADEIVTNSRAAVARSRTRWAAGEIKVGDVVGPATPA